MLEQRVIEGEKSNSRGSSVIRSHKRSNGVSAASHGGSSGGGGYHHQRNQSDMLSQMKQQNATMRIFAHEKSNSREDSIEKWSQ
jgi:hypothetical protein